MEIKTLRDEIAIAALNGLIASGTGGMISDGSWTFPEVRAKIAYEYADAMLLERQKKTDTGEE